MHQNEHFEYFCSELHFRLQEQLPGYEAQKLMEPPTRKELLSLKHPEPPREGAVLIALFPYGEKLGTIMIQRVVYDGVHSGQIAFPGGRRDPGDPSLIDTALREAVEEVGLRRSQIRLLGTLTPLYIPPSNFDVLPVVARLDHVPKLTIQTSEVEEAFVVGIDELSKPENSKLLTIEARSQRIRSVPAYSVQGKTIWGATAMIISELLAVLPPYKPESGL